MRWSEVQPFLVQNAKGGAARCCESPYPGISIYWCSRFIFSVVKREVPRPHLVQSMLANAQCYWSSHISILEVIFDLELEVSNKENEAIQAKLFGIQNDLLQNAARKYIACLKFMRVVPNSFIWKTSSSQKTNYFRRTFANSMFIFRGTCWRRFRKTWMCDILKLFQASDPSSHFILRQLRLNIYVLL